MRLCVWPLYLKATHFNPWIPSTVYPRINNTSWVQRALKHSSVCMPRCLCLDRINYIHISSRRVSNFIATPKGNWIEWYVQVPMQSTVLCCEISIGIQQQAAILCEGFAIQGDSVLPCIIRSRIYWLVVPKVALLVLCRTVCTSMVIHCHTFTSLRANCNRITSKLSF